MLLIIDTLLIIASLYLAIGVLYGIYFIIKGGPKIDPTLKASKFSIRYLLFPGSIICWPFLIFKSTKL